MKFNISNAMKFSKKRFTCNRVDVVTPCFEEFFRFIVQEDPLKRCLATLLSKRDFEKKINDVNMESVGKIFALEVLEEMKGKPKVEKLHKKPIVEKIRDP